MKLVIHPAVEPERLEKIVRAAGAMTVVNPANAAEAEREIEDADAFFGKITFELLARAKRLRWVQAPTASLEHYLFAALVEHPCVVTNMRGLFSDVVADHVMGYVLCFARNLHLYLRQQSARRWEPIGGESERTGFVTGPGRESAIDRAHTHLSDRTMGIVGFGAIGAEIGRRAGAFGMRVLAVDVRPKEPLPGMAAVWGMERLNELLAGSDFVTIAAPHTPATARLFRRPLFQAMKPTAYLINVGRGVIVDLKDLTDALQAGEIAGAALDVFEVEPLPADHPLWGMESVILTPHIAAASTRIAERHLEALLTNVARFAAGQELVNVVDKTEWF